MFISCRISDVFFRDYSNYSPKNRVRCVKLVPEAVNTTDTYLFIFSIRNGQDAMLREIKDTFSDKINILYESPLAVNHYHNSKFSDSFLPQQKLVIMEFHDL